MHAKTVVLAHENELEFVALLTDYLGHYSPLGLLENQLVHEMAAARWRLNRVLSMETAVFDEEVDRLLNDEENPVSPDRVLGIAYDNLANGPALNRIHKFECRLQRQFETAQKQLLALQRARSFSGYKPIQNEPEFVDVAAREIFRQINKANPNAHPEEFLDACIRSLPKNRPDTSNEKPAARAAGA